VRYALEKTFERTLPLPKSHCQRRTGMAVALIGAGVYLDEIETIIAEQKNRADAVNTLP